MFIPGEEALEDGELRVTVLGSGNPWNTRAQASASIMVEAGNPERDILLFDIGSGSLANYARQNNSTNCRRLRASSVRPSSRSRCRLPIGGRRRSSRSTESGV